jgi:ATP-binding cassette subfamily E protein 1
MPKRIAIIDKKICNPKICNWLCVRVCPVNRANKKCIATNQRPIIDEQICIGCGICVKKCPNQAIAIVNLPEQIKGEPIWRYGQNGFALWDLPIPKPSAITVLVGQNGIGKSTVMAILAGQLAPKTEFLKRYKGTELQDYLKMLSEKKVKVALKPQAIDAIPKLWKGKVADALKKVNINFEDVLKTLGVDIADKNIESLSGGELQMLAIAATLLKEADLYFFDEPSSYLDVRQRLVAAQAIRSLAEKGKRVVVIEHDLAVADYLADFVCIAFGQPGSYGMISKPYGVRVGINTYLDGYIKEMNMRFRPEPITFAIGKERKKAKQFLSWPVFEKRFTDFELRTEGGTINCGEIIGIIGPNSTGKTTFISMMAGQLKPDNLEWQVNLTIGYKQQRILLNSEQQEMVVGQFLPKVDGRDRVVSTLDIARLFQQKLGQLSGGELQSVFIAKTLLEPANILLFDEPSAFLDVEQRLRFAKLLRNWIEMTGQPAFVVDHDLLFINAIADRLIVFSGQPGKRGFGRSPQDLRSGMNNFLCDIGITFRRDPATGRPRANKPCSVLDREQKASGQFYY